MRRKDWADRVAENIVDEINDYAISDRSEEQMTQAISRELRRAFFRGLAQEFTEFERERRNDRNYDYCHSQDKKTPPLELGELHLKSSHWIADDYETYVDPALAKKANEA